jgi:predicted RNA-binding Zn-ribbon protein involved in translation (DUF1610 family)
VSTPGKYLIRKDPDPDPRFCWYYTWTGPEEDRDYGSHETWEMALASVLRDLEEHATVNYIGRLADGSVRYVSCEQRRRAVFVSEEDADSGRFWVGCGEAHPYVEGGADCGVVDCHGRVGDDRPRCPTWPVAPDGTPHTVTGCGSTNVQWDEDDQVYDCLNCGIFFDPKGEVAGERGVPVQCLTCGWTGTSNEPSKDCEICPDGGHVVTVR